MESHKRDGVVLWQKKDRITLNNLAAELEKLGSIQRIAGKIQKKDGDIVREIHFVIKNWQRQTEITVRHLRDLTHATFLDVCLRGSAAFTYKKKKH